ncbi:gamma-glutamyltransferase [Jiella sonneratiae]|uniref:Gamma-glutamyltransferase n=1 Tax=Jiella sonneratiae TaxID=2816856 RepID=A0ABS3J5P2_9HYPH|nr:gamma-glutamyltransferase [Jiella sonneratiae]MBO0904989.1 gamma-glutamyltransferase [Jiella sonneratiae]
MKSALSRSQTVRKTVCRSKGGVVAAQNRLAAEIGAEVLAAGGDAADAAVAVSFAIGVLEPWMSGPGGGGALVVWRAGEDRAHALNYGMRSPRELRVEDYPTAEGETAGDLFPWKMVVGNRNVRGPLAIAVPGTVAGAGALHHRFGRIAWSDLLAPAVAAAEDGMRVDWYAALHIASVARDLAADPDAAGLFLDDGTWPKGSGWTALSDLRLDQSQMAKTLRAIAAEGPDSFYRGAVAADLVADLRAKGSRISMDDLSDYRPEWSDALEIGYRDAIVHALPGLTAGPTLAHALSELERGWQPGAAPDAATYRAYGDALATAYRHRLSTMGDLGEAAEASGCTTHFSVVDRAGNMVAMTQTLLSSFGSCVVSPSTGLLMNNGIMWFDPEPGRPNSLAPGRRCLMNVCPVVVGKGGRRWALGASGGRKIMPAVMQLASFLTDFDMTLEDAFHQPRIDRSGGDALVADDALARPILNELSRTTTVVETRRTVFPYAFACPAGVGRDPSGANEGMSEIMSPWGDAVAEPGDDVS